MAHCLLNGLAHKDLGAPGAARTPHFTEDCLGADVFDHIPHYWWKVAENRFYICENMSRHLQSAGLTTELTATVLNLQWMAALMKSGGIL